MIFKGVFSFDRTKKDAPKSLQLTKLCKAKDID